MLFNFRLFPFAELISVIRPVETHRPISWFDLTDGWYWIDVGEEQLFRYSQAAFQGMKNQQLRFTNDRYVDYHVDVFFSSIIEHLPTQLEPLPAFLVERVSLFKSWQGWLKAWNEWMYTQDDQTEELLDELDVNLSVNWWYERMVNTGYLTEAPNIWFWSDGISIHINWDNRDRLRNGVVVWEAQIGHIQLLYEDFLVAVHTFNQEFMSAMDKRIGAATEYRTETLSVQNTLSLQQVQRQKASRLEDVLFRSVNTVPTNWEQVLAAIALVERDPRFVRIYKEITINE